MAPLRPQRVGHAQFDAFLFGGLTELALELRKTGMDSALVRVEMERLAHLLLGLAFRSRVGHGQSRRDAARGEEHVPWRSLELSVEIEGKSRVAFDGGRRLCRTNAWRRERNRE